MKQMITLVALAVLTATLAWAVPPTMNFQGSLKDDLGAPVPNGPYDLTFRIYDDPDAGAMLWESVDVPVMVNESTFSVVLGNAMPLELPFEGGTWLGVSVADGEELMPRFQLTSVPYAFRARTADDLGGLGADAFADTAHVHDAGAIVDGVIAGDRLPIGHGPDDVAAGDHMHGLDNMADVDTTGIGDGRVLTYTAGTWRPQDVPGGGGSDSDWTVSGNDQYSAVSGNVGIGTSTPVTKLDVQGNLQVGTVGAGFGVNFWSDQSNDRLWWDPATASLRFGDPDGGAWAPEKMGLGSLAGGLGSSASGSYATALGNRAHADSTCSVALGRNVQAGNKYSMVLGRGTDFLNPLVNDTENSLVVGFETTTPTLFVGGSGHRVGVGTPTPAEKLDVDGTVRATGFQMPTGAADGKVLTSDATGAADWEDPPVRHPILVDMMIGTPSSIFVNFLHAFGPDSVTIVAPTSGHIVVTSTVYFSIDHTYGLADSWVMGHCQELTSGFVDDEGTVVGIVPASYPSISTLAQNAVVISTYTVSSGTHTYYLAGRMDQVPDMWDLIYLFQTTAIFYPDN
jgi:hypothetical protein